MAIQESQPLFGASVNEVNVNMEGTKREGMRAQDIARSKGDAIDFGGLMGQASQLTGAIVNAQKATDANEAKADWVNIYNSEGYKNADDALRAELIEEQLGTLGDRSDAYDKAFRANIYSEYDRVYKGRQVIENNAIYNSAPNSFKLYEMETGGTAESFVNDMATEYPQLDKNVLKTSLLDGVYQDIYTEVGNATNEAELSTALMNVEDLKASYQGDKFMQTKSKQGQELIRANESKVNNLVKAKQAEFVTMHKTKISNAIDEGYSEHPIKLEADFDGAYKDPLTKQSKKAQYSKKYGENEEAIAFNVDFPLGTNPQRYPNDMAKEQRQIAVTDKLGELFATNQTSEFVRVASGEKGLTKEAGDMLLSVVDRSTDPKELGAVFVKIAKISEMPQGATTLRQMFTDDEYVRVMKTAWVNKYRPEYTPQQSRDYVHGTAKNITPVPFAPNDKADMMDYATKLGRQGDKFLGIMGEFAKTDPAMAKDMMKDVYKFFDKQKGETTTGITTDNSMGNVPESLDVERTDKMIDEVLPGSSSYTYVDDIIVGYDDIGGVVNIVNSTPIISKSNSNYEDSMIREQELKQNATITSDPGLVIKETIKNVGRSTLDNTGSFLFGVPEVIGDVVGNIGEAIWGNAMRNLKETNPDIYALFNADSIAEEKAIKPDDFDEILLDVLYEKSEKLNTSMPNNIQNNTFSAQMQDLVNNSLLRNEADKAKVDAVIEVVEENLVNNIMEETKASTRTSKEEEVKAPTKKEIPRVRLLPNVTSKFEGDVGTVSTGKGDLGGISYGKHQMASGEGTVQGFVKAMYKEEFKGMEVNSKEYQAKWKELAKKDPEKFEADQDKYIYDTLQKPVIEQLSKSGLDIYAQPEAIQGLLNSLTVQHGSDAGKMFKKAMGKVGKNTILGKDFVVSIFDQRMGVIPKGEKYTKRGSKKQYVSDGTILRKFRSSSKAVQRGVRNRFLKERQLFLDMLK